jgi:hypothetical protein
VAACARFVSFQNSGSEAFWSSSAISRFSRSTSKMPPERIDARSEIFAELVGIVRHDARL